MHVAASAAPSALALAMDDAIPSAPAVPCALAVVAPAFGTNVAGNGCRLAGTPHELTPQEAEACQEAARRACIRRFSVWTEPVAGEGGTAVR